jgi:hypothetical protein
MLGAKVLGSEECLRTLPLRARRARGEMDKKGERSEGVRLRLEAHASF